MPFLCPMGWEIPQRYPNVRRKTIKMKTYGKCPAMIFEKAVLRPCFLLCRLAALTRQSLLDHMLHPRPEIGRLRDRGLGTL